MHGQPLNFGLGRTLKGNEGIVAAGREDHAKAVEAVRRAVASVQAKQ
jgi:3'(2'), 5'-bisphosphate nucleotidase